MAFLNLLLLSWSLALVAGMLIALWVAFVAPVARRRRAHR
jgi:hypothetical protein